MAREHNGIPLESMPENRAVSRVQSGNSSFLWQQQDLRLLSSSIQGVRPCLVLSTELCFPFRVVKWVSRPPVTFRREIGAFSRGSAGASGLLSCCEGILGVPLELAKGNQDLS